ncbi:MAG: hypothetical protein ACLGI3_16825 [Actinomycetes bacterium]
MARTDVGQAANARLAQVVDYGPDPRGWAMFAALSGHHNRTLNSQRAVVASHPEHNGWMRPLQRMIGLAPLGMGTAPARRGPNAEIGDERSSELDNPAMRIFAERLKRGGMQL